MGTIKSRNEVYIANGRSYRRQIRAINGRLLEALYSGDDRQHDRFLAAKAVLSAIELSSDTRLSDLNSYAHDFGIGAKNTAVFCRYFDRFITNARGY